MSGKYLLDTNIVIALFANDVNVVEHLHNSENIFVPSIVLGELFYGALKSTNVKYNIERIKNFADNTSILSCDSETARFYGTIKNQLKSIGKPIPENDIWIASIAKQYELTLITRADHFKFVENISIEMW